jgi:hypothetical protein
MRRLLRAAARLYPATWRQRYGSEFDALIDDLTPGWRDVVNIAIGALMMQMSRVAFLPVALALAGGGAGMAVSLAMPPAYASSSQVLVQMPEPAGDAGERALRIREALEAALRATAIDKRSISIAVRSDLGRDPLLLEVSASADSARAAQQATEKALGSIIDANFIAGQQRAAGSGVQFRVVEVPNLPTAGRPGTARNSSVGAAVGLMTGLVVVLMASRRRRMTAGNR